MIHSCFTTTPPFITKRTCSSTCTSLSGLPGYRDQIRQLPRGDLAAVGDAKKIGRVECGGPDRVDWLHAVAHQDRELLGVVTVRIDRGVGAEGDFHAGADGFAVALLRQGNDLLHFRLDRRRHLGRINRRKQVGGGNEVGPTLLHQGDGLVIEHGAVFDGGHPGPHRGQDPLRPVGMRGHLQTVTGRLLHDGPHLVF